MSIRVYSGRVTNWPLVWVMNVLAVVLLVSGLSSGVSVPLIVGAVLIVAANLMISSVRTTVGPRGVVVHFGVLGWPRFTYPLERIAGAEAIDVPWTRMGGWGIHWSPWRGTRLTIRTGPSLRLRLVTGGNVTISAQRPADAIAVLAVLHPLPR